LSIGNFFWIFWGLDKHPESCYSIFMAKKSKTRIYTVRFEDLKNHTLSDMFSMMEDPWVQLHVDIEPLAKAMNSVIESANANTGPDRGAAKQA